MATVDFDADVARRIDATYATQDITATRVAAFRAAAPRTRETALDIGCGPGYLTRELAVAVETSGHIVGVDASESMLELARRRCAGLGQVRLERADALELPVGDAAVDVACVMQVYCYVKELQRALTELHRVLRPGGRAVILDSDVSGVVWESQNRERMQKVLRAYDAHAAWPDLPRVLPRRLRHAGFELERCEKVPFLTLDYHPNTYVFGLARFIRQFVVGNGFPADEADAWLAEFDALEKERGFFFSMDRFLFVARRV
jgi:ubiquinone/menaquinone biosynthesis C-methylase UbiE